MATLGKLVALAALSALSLFFMHSLVQNTNIEVQYIVFCVNLVVLAITAVAFSTFTSIEEKMENLRLKEKLAKLEHSTLKTMVEFVSDMESKKEEVIINGIQIDTFPEEKKEESNINPRTKKPYKTSPEKRKVLREIALKREQEKRIQKTADDSKKRKARK